MNDAARLPENEIKTIGELNKEFHLAHANAIAVPVHIRDTFYTRYGKRWLDFFVSLIALIITAPVNLVLALGTYLDVGTPILFRQTRTGKGQKEFELIKFRNMTNATDSYGYLLPPEERVTRFGRFVRRTSLDELLNFWSILKGNMSIIGPRPLHAFYTPWMTDRHAARFAVRPGLECPTLDTQKEVVSWQGRFENDVWYVENCSLMLDIRLLLQLFRLVFFPNRKHEREVGESGTFIGYDVLGKAVSSRNVPDDVLQCFLQQNHYASLEEARNHRFAATTAEVETESETSTDRQDEDILAV